MRQHDNSQGLCAGADKELAAQTIKYRWHDQRRALGLTGLHSLKLRHQARQSAAILICKIWIYKLIEKTKKRSSSTINWCHLQFKLHQQLIQICELSRREIQTNATDSKCEITGCRNTARQNIFTPPFHPSPSLAPATPAAYHWMKCSVQLPIIQSTGVDT